jgi:hypothetical protein
LFVPIWAGLASYGLSAEVDIVVRLWTHL